MKNRKKQGKIKLLLVVIFCLTLGFALLSTTLKINGTAGIKSNRWSIHWDDDSIDDSGVTPTTAADVTDTDKQNISFAVQLELPGDYYEFTVDAVNDGTINGAIDSIKKNYYKQGETTPSAVPSYIDYTVVYADSGEEPKKGDILEANGGKIKYKVRVEFKSTEKTLPNDTSVGTYEFNVDYIQSKEEKSIDSIFYTTADIILYNPVTNKYCKSTGEDNCYEWIITNIDETNEKVDLMYLREVDELSSTQDSYTILENYTNNWNESLSVDSSYNLPANSNGFSGKSYSGYKARLPILSDFTDRVDNKLKEENIAQAIETPKNYITLIYDTNSYGYRGYTSDNVSSGSAAPLQYTMTNSSSSNYYIHPIIKVDMTDEYVFFDIGTPIYVNPTTYKLCTKSESDANVNSNNKATNIKDGCMKWYVLSYTNDTINLLSDHNTTAHTYH